MADYLLHIFLEAAHRASLIPLASEATIYAMKSFGTAAMELPVAIAVVGGVFGHGMNILLGCLLMRLPSSPKHLPFFQKLQQYFNRYGFILLVFAPLALGNVLSLASGMLGTSLKKSLPMIALGLIYHYGQLLQ